MTLLIMEVVTTTKDGNYNPQARGAFRCSCNNTIAHGFQLCRAQSWCLHGCLIHPMCRRCGRCSQRQNRACPSRNQTVQASRGPVQKFQFSCPNTLGTSEIRHRIRVSMDSQLSFPGNCQIGSLTHSDNSPKSPMLRCAIPTGLLRRNQALRYRTIKTSFSTCAPIPKDG
jgi:hypothetical protein